MLVDLGFHTWIEEDEDGILHSNRLGSESGKMTLVVEGAWACWYKEEAAPHVAQVMLPVCIVRGRRRRLLIIRVSFPQQGRAGVLDETDTFGDSPNAIHHAGEDEAMAVAGEGLGSGGHGEGGGGGGGWGRSTGTWDVGGLVCITSVWKDRKELSPIVGSNLSQCSEEKLDGLCFQHDVAIVV